ncbi:MAG: NADH-quinone oxidoreductase subunit J [Trueperaceae bacterium]|nr:NADH-quinone oxidoreductase subunit J [Trueperaceae bacterium]
MLVFIVLSVVMLIGAIGVVTLRQPVHAALSLVGTLLTLGVAYVQLHAHFLAAIQVIVYAGAIMVLFLFVIMLLNLGDEGPVTPRLAWIRPAAWIVGAVTAAGIAAAVFADPRVLPDAATIAAVFTGSGVEQIADQLFGPYVLSFQLVGVLLLTGIVAAVGLVQRKAVTSASAQGRSVGASGRTPPKAPPMDAGATSAGTRSRSSSATAERGR